MGLGMVNVDVGKLGDAARGVLEGVGSLAKDLRVAVTGKDPELDKKLAEIEAAAMAGQVEINRIEAQNPNVFVSGWRPFIGWICGLALGYQYLIQPFLVNVMSVWDIPIIIKNPEIGDLLTLLIAMLGMSGLRSLEKIKGA